eukprot:ctg_2218.g523
MPRAPRRAARRVGGGREGDGGGRRDAARWMREGREKDAPTANIGRTALLGGALGDMAAGDRRTGALEAAIRQAVGSAGGGVVAADAAAPGGGGVDACRRAASPAVVVGCGACLVRPMRYRRYRRLQSDGERSRVHHAENGAVLLHGGTHPREHPPIRGAPRTAHGAPAGAAHPSTAHSPRRRLGAGAQRARAAGQRVPDAIAHRAAAVRHRARAAGPSTGAALRQPYRNVSARPPRPRCLPHGGGRGGAADALGCARPAGVAAAAARCAGRARASPVHPAQRHRECGRSTGAAHLRAHPGGHRPAGRDVGNRCGALRGATRATHSHGVVGAAARMAGGAVRRGPRPGQSVAGASTGRCHGQRRVPRRAHAGGGPRGGCECPTAPARSETGAGSGHARATAGGDGRGDDAEAGRYRWVLDRVTHILRERDDRRDMPSWRWLLATLNGTVAHRVYSPRVALHAQLAAEDWMRVRGGGDDDDDVQPEDAWALVVCGDGAFAVDAGALASISDDWTAVCADRGHRSGDRRPEQHTLHGDQRRRIILSLDHVRSNQSTWSPFAESHHNAEHAGPTATVVLYADLLRDRDFSAMHRQLTHAAAASHVVYVLRHRVPLAAASGTPTTPPLSLAGYSVEVAIKSTDYIALDDESLGEHPGTAAAHTTTVTEASTEKVLEDVADLNRTEVDERLGVVALQSVVGALSNVGHSVSSRHPSIDPLTYVEQLSGDLPSLAPLILRAHAGPRTGVPMAAPESLEEALLSLEAHLQELGAGVSVSSLPSALFINGRPVASSAPRMLQCASAVYAAATAVESAGMIDASGRRASATTPDLHALMFQLPPAAAPDQHGAYTESVSMRLRLADDAPSANTTLLDRQRCDLHAVLVHLNDIERNRKYQHWNDSYRGLLSSSDPHHHHHDNDSAAAHLPQVRRNLFRVRALVDPASAVGLDMLVQLLDLVQSTRPLLPLQVSVVLVPRWNASEVACGECAAVAQSASSDTRIPETLGRTDSVSVAVTRAFFYLLHEHDSLRDAVSFVRAVHWQAQREHPYAQVALMLGSVAALPPMPPQLHHVRAAFTIQYRRAHSVDEATAKRAFERICLQGISPVSFATSSPSPSSTSPVLACEPALCGHRVYRALNLPLDAPSMVFFNGLLMSDGTVVHGGDHDVGTMLLREWRRLAAQVRAGRLPDEMSSEEAIFGKDVSTDGQMMTAPTILRMSAYEPQLLRPERGTTAGPGDVVAGASRALPHWLAGGHGSHAKSKRIAYLGNAAYHAMPASTAPNVRNVVTVWLFEDWQRRDGWQSLAWMLRALQQLDNATDTHPVAVRLALFPTDGRATAALAELMHRYADSAVATCPTAALSALEWRRNCRRIRRRAPSDRGRPVGRQGAAASAARARNGAHAFPRVGTRGRSSVDVRNGCRTLHGTTVARTASLPPHHHHDASPFHRRAHTHLLGGVGTPVRALPPHHDVERSAGHADAPPQVLAAGQLSVAGVPAAAAALVAPPRVRLPAGDVFVAGVAAAADRQAAPHLGLQAALPGRAVPGVAAPGAVYRLGPGGARRPGRAVGHRHGAGRGVRFRALLRQSPGGGRVPLLEERFLAVAFARPALSHFGAVSGGLGTLPQHRRWRHAAGAVSAPERRPAVVGQSGSGFAQLRQRAAAGMESRHVPDAR